MYTFDEVIGHSLIKRSLIAAIDSDKVSHSYIFFGEALSGKKLIAKSFAKLLLCASGNSLNCSCVSCRTFDSNNNPDVFYVVPSKTKSIGIDDIREQVLKNIEIKPYKYKYKIFIIDNADSMSVAAQNSLLKTIEEPPDYGVFLLLSKNNRNFLPTVLSRCVVFKLMPIAFLQIASYLEDKFAIPNRSALVFAAFAQGNLGKAIEFATSDFFMNLRGNVIEWLSSLSDRNIVGVLGIPSEIDSLGFKDKTDELLDIAIMWYRDIIALKETNNIKFVIQQDYVDLIATNADKMSFDDLYSCIDAVFNAKRHLTMNANWQLVLEAMLLVISKK